MSDGMKHSDYRGERRSATSSREAGTLVGLAVGLAFVVAVAAVGQHDACTDAGYQLAVAQREGIELRRICARVEQRVATLRSPASAIARAQKWQLGLAYPRTWNVVSASTRTEPVATVDSAVPAAEGRHP